MKEKDVKGTLLLSRKEDENIVILVGNEKIIINLEECSNSRCKIRIDAPQHIKIYRGEIYKQENCLFNIKK